MIKVKMFDFEHELDLEEAINEYLEDFKESEIIDIKYQLAVMYDNKEQVYCYSAMIIYKEK